MLAALKFSHGLVVRLRSAPPYSPARATLREIGSINGAGPPPIPGAARAWARRGPLRRTRAAAGRSYTCAGDKPVNPAREPMSSYLAVAEAA